MKTSTKLLTAKRRAKEEKTLRAARRNLTIYKRLIWTRYRHAAHLDALDALLMECTRHAETLGRIGVAHAIVEMPPRHGKTATISRLYPTWHLGRNPDHRVILASYGASLAHKNSRYARNIFEMPRFRSVFPQAQLDPQSKAADAWNLAPGAGIDYVSWQWTEDGQLEMTQESVEGGADAMGVGGGITGLGGNIILIDDPVKSREEAESQTYRNKVWDWFTDDLYTRREPGAAIILVMTRWHEDDLAGRLLREQPGKWARLRMPALAEENDPLKRFIGAPLWPDRFSLVELNNIADTLGDYSFSALYQQKPVPAEGGLFKRRSFKEIPAAPDPLSLVQVVRFWDLAMSERTTADYTVGVKMGLYADGRYVTLHAHRVRLDWSNVPGKMAEIALDDGPDVVIGFEKAGYMSRAGQDLVADPRLHEYAIFGYPKTKDKVTNALPFAARVGQGMVDVVEAWWTRDYLDELCSFPNGAHDDQVDASAGAYDMLGTGGIEEGQVNYAPEHVIGSGDY